MKYPSITIQGQIIAPELVDQLEQSQTPGQAPQDFGLERSAKLRDEIGRTWAEIADYWRIFRRRMENLKEGQKGTTETRNLWVIPFLSSLGYRLEYSQPETILDRSFDISHRAANLDGFPVLIVSEQESLDKKPEGTTRLRMSPHSTMQEYLNLTEHTYGLVTNGKTLRLLRDSGRISRLSFVEFNLEKMIEDDIYSDFSVLFRLIHATRMPQRQALAEESMIEQYHQTTLEEGDRVREELSVNVEKCIRIFANGLLAHSQNEKLREKVNAGELDGPGFYHLMLRLIYRFLFLMVIEDRRLVFPETKDTTARRLAEFYYRYYSIARIRGLVEQRHLVEADKDDLWINVKQTFRIFEDQTVASKLGIMALQGDLFDDMALGPIENCHLDNKTLVDALHCLCFFEHPQTGALTKINYERLNVEEFGSIYEGLLEITGELTVGIQSVEFSFSKDSGRSKTGSHYTPEELVQPLIKHSLDYVIEDKLKKAAQGNSKDLKQAKEDALLSIRVCDVACGSGHILLSAARRIAMELARLRTGEDQPNPQDYGKAKRDVIRHCIYGVDKNPLAVELCKTALWLEAHNPGEPLNFLDHHIKCGDAIVGLAHRDELEKGIPDEAFKKLPGDDKDVASAFLKRNKQERAQRGQMGLELKEKLESDLAHVSEFLAKVDAMPESTPEEVARKKLAYTQLERNLDYARVKALADLQVAQFFTPKTVENKSYICTDTTFRDLMNLRKITGQEAARANALGVERKFFHWFLEFPDVFRQSGFDCVLGNPPFLGGKRISTHYGNAYLNHLKKAFEPDGGITDVVAYFFRRAFAVLRNGGFQALISTNTISQGGTRVTALEYITSTGGEICFATKSIKWPGRAAVVVSLISIGKNATGRSHMLNNDIVSYINSYLDSGYSISPEKLHCNRKQCFVGSYVLGTGFILDQGTASEFLKTDPRYSEILFTYLNGEDFNSTYDCSATRWVIDFKEMTVDEAASFQLAFNLVRERVLPQRLKKREKRLARLWWQFARPASDLYKEIDGLTRVIVTARTSKTLAFGLVRTNQVFSSNLTVIAKDSFREFALLQSNLHSAWSWTYGTTMKTDLIYAPNECFENFPLPTKMKNSLGNGLENIGRIYHEHRNHVMASLRIGLTRVYNLFHTRGLLVRQAARVADRVDKKIIKTENRGELQNLWNNLQKNEGTCSIEEAVAAIIRLRELHVQMDQAVLEAYGWQDIDLRHDFYEVDYLPENDRVRFTIHPDARREILKRLLELNHKIHDEEVKAGLWDEKKGKKAGKAKKSKIAEHAGPGAGLFEGEGS